MQVDEVVAGTERAHGSQGSEDQEHTAIRNASSHSFLRRAIGHHSAPSWTMTGSIRHSNIVRFEFRCYETCRHKLIDLEREDLETPSITSILLSSAFLIHPEQLHELATLWTAERIDIPDINPREPIHITLYFQTYCDQWTWQLNRVLTCFLWTEEPTIPFTTTNTDNLPAIQRSDGTLDSFEMADCRGAILDTQQIHGRDSVWYALQGVSMVFRPGQESHRPHWMSFEKVNMPERASGILMDLKEVMRLDDFIISRVTCCARLAEVDPSFERRLRSTMPDLGQDTRIGNSMIAVRSPSWSADCPKFCLFVLLEQDYDENDILYLLLEEAIALKNYYGGDGCHFGRSDWQTLRDWRRALKIEIK